MAKKKSILKKSVKKRTKRVLKSANEPKTAHRLLTWIKTEASRRGLEQTGIADALGITYGYWYKIKDGFPKGEISREFAESSAKFLNVPRLAVLIAADYIIQEDVYMPGVDLEYEVSKAIDFIITDKQWAAFCPTDLKELTIEVQLFIVKLYEKASGRRLLPDSLDISQAFEELEKMSS